MFPRSQRIRTSEDIIKVIRHGKRRSQGIVTCYFLAKPGTLSRITVIVDSKVSKKAVVRNLLKRQVRAILASTALTSGDTIIRLFKGAEGIRFQELQVLVQQCLHHLA